MVGDRIKSGSIQCKTEKIGIKSLKSSCLESTHDDTLYLVLYLTYILLKQSELNLALGFFQPLIFTSVFGSHAGHLAGRQLQEHSLVHHLVSPSMPGLCLLMHLCRVSQCEPSQGTRYKSTPNKFCSRVPLLIIRSHAAGAASS